MFDLIFISSSWAEIVSCVGVTQVVKFNRNCYRRFKNTKIWTSFFSDSLHVPRSIISRWQSALSTYKFCRTPAGHTYSICSICSRAFMLLHFGATLLVKMPPDAKKINLTLEWNHKTKPDSLFAQIECFWFDTANIKKLPSFQGEENVHFLLRWLALFCFSEKYSEHSHILSPPDTNKGSVTVSLHLTPPLVVVLCNPNPQIGLYNQYRGTCAMNNTYAV